MLYYLIGVFMRILLTNDDGIHAEGIDALVRALSAEHELVVAAPDSERSGASHSLTFSTPIRMREARNWNDLPDSVRAYAINGTPVDCVKLACGNLDFQPDLVLSGINIGQNIGTDVFYSGTVSAAFEGALLDIPSIAVSIASFTPKNIGAAAEAMRRMLKWCVSEVFVISRFLNINIPDLPLESMRGVKWAPLSRQEYDKTYIERLDPHDRRYYWIPSGRAERSGAKEEDTDERWVLEGYIAVTPLKTDITDEERLNQLRQVRIPLDNGM